MFEEPSYLVQVGHHGKNRVYNAIEQDHLDGAVLSPTDYTPSHNTEMANHLSDNEKLTLFDPQFYLPAQGDRKDLNKYDYHDNFGGDDYTPNLVYDSSIREEFAKAVIDAQDSYDTDAYISPAASIDEISKQEVDDWLDLTEGFIEVAKKYGKEDTPIFASLPVNGDRLNDEERRNYLLNAATTLDSTGFYISVAYSDRDTRLPLKGEDDIKSQLDLFATLRVNRYKVIAAHTHQISHLLFSMGADAVASGHYKNLRTFDTERWVVPDETQIRTPVIRYYSDELLASIRPDSLLNELYETNGFDEDKIRNESPYESDLFEGSLSPANTGWGKAEGSWDHYTWVCHQISREYQGEELEQRTQIAKEKIRKGRAVYKQINSGIDEYVDELDSDIYDDWENALSSMVETNEFERLKRLV